MTINDLEPICNGFVSYTNITGTILQSPEDHHAGDRIQSGTGRGVIIEDRFFLCKENSVKSFGHAGSNAPALRSAPIYKILRPADRTYALYCLFRIEKTTATFSS